MATQTEPKDPWGAESARPVAQSDSKGDDGEIIHACPHCGQPLRPHHDAVGTWHCDSKDCVDCCFLPPDAKSAGQVRPRLEARPCPTAAKASGF